MVDLKKVFISNVWASHKLSRTEVGNDVERLTFDHEYWEKVEKLASIYEALYTVVHIIDSEVNFSICIMSISIYNVILS